MSSNITDPQRLIPSQLRAAIILQTKQEMRELSGRYGRHLVEDLEAVEKALVYMVKCWAIARDPHDRFGLRRKVESAHRMAVRHIVVKDAPSGMSRHGLTLVHIYSRKAQGLAHYRTDVDIQQSARQVFRGIQFMFHYLEEQVPPLIRLAECADAHQI
jgi:hypothetical protein